MNKSYVNIIALIVICLVVLLLFKTEDYIYTDYTYKCIKKDENPERKIYEQEIERAYTQCVEDETVKMPPLTRKSYLRIDYDYILDSANQKVKAENICKNRKLNNELLATPPPPWYINEKEDSCTTYGKIKCIQFFGMCFFKIVPSL